MQAHDRAKASTSCVADLEALQCIGVPLISPGLTALVRLGFTASKPPPRSTRPAHHCFYADRRNKPSNRSSDHHHSSRAESYWPPPIGRSRRKRRCMCTLEMRLTSTLGKCSTIRRLLPHYLQQLCSNCAHLPSARVCRMRTLAQFHIRGNLPISKLTGLAINPIRAWHVGQGHFVSAARHCVKTWTSWCRCTAQGHGCRPPHGPRFRQVSRTEGFCRI